MVLAAAARHLTIGLYGVSVPVSTVLGKMMNRLVEVPLGQGGNVLVELDELSADQGTRRMERDRSALAERAMRRVEALPRWSPLLPLPDRAASVDRRPVGGGWDRVGRANAYAIQGHSVRRWPGVLHGAHDLAS